MSCRGFEICVSAMDAESCWSDAFCSSLPQDKSFNKNTFIFTQEKEDDAFIFISDLLHVPDDCDFSDASLRFYDESTPNSSQTDLDNFLASLLTESETHNTFTVPVPETKNSLYGDPGKMGSTFLYSGPIHTEVQTTRPTLINVQSVLSMYDRKEQASPAFMPTTSISNTPSIFESLRSAKLPPFLNSLNELSYRRLRRPRSEGKYVVKVKYPGIGIDDGYKWRKYGQKAIKNSPYPRSYYRCTYPKCKAKKQLERCIENPDTLSITYEGLHPHYSYPSFQISEQLNYSLRQQNNNIYEKGENKKAVIDNVFNGCFNNEGGDVMQSSESPTIVAAHQQLQEEQDKCYESLRFGTENSDIMDIVVEEEGGEWRRDGLLQDIVPFQVINPLSSSSFPFSSSSSSP